MKVHEYQARQLLTNAGVAIPGGLVIESPEQAEAAYKQLAAEGAAYCVIKAQVHTGGRGKAGGVRLVRSAQEAHDAAHAILSKPLVTVQTGPEGIKVRKLLIAAAVDIAKEYYLSVTTDRAAGRPVLIASSEGGVEIEKVAEENPDAIIRHHLHPLLPIQPFEARMIAYKLGFKGDHVKQAVKIITCVADMFRKLDADLVEINPMVVTKPCAKHPEGQVLAIDAKITFDDNAMFRHKDIAEMHDPSEEPASEIEARKFDLNFIKLEGNIGCLVNGAGLAMATMDIVKLHGASPANFLDVGGSATEEAVTQAFRIILQDPTVQGVLVNIFGGIMQCDRIARAIVAAAGQVGFKVPLVVRLEGTNVEQARKILQEARASIPVLQTATDLTDAAQKITAAVKAA